MKASSKKSKTSLSTLPPQEKKKHLRTTEKATIRLSPTVKKAAVHDSNGRTVGFEVRGDLILNGKVDFDNKYQRTKIFKRNTFKVADACYSIKHSQGLSKSLLYIDQRTISSLSLVVSGSLNREGGREIELEQFTNAKRTEKRVPPRREMPPHIPSVSGTHYDAAQVYGAGLYAASTGEANHGATSTCEWTRMSFKYGTSHNGDRRSAQTYYCLVLSLVANLASGEQVTVASCSSPQYIVIARSPTGIKASGQPAHTRHSNEQRKVVKKAEHEAAGSLPEPELSEDATTVASTRPTSPEPLMGQEDPKRASDTAKPKTKDSKEDVKVEEIPFQDAQHPDELDLQTEIELFEGPTVVTPSPEDGTGEPQRNEERSAQDFSGLFDVSFDMSAQYADDFSDDPSMTHGRTMTVSEMQTPVKLVFDAFPCDDGFLGTVDDDSMDSVAAIEAQQLFGAGPDLHSEIGSSAGQKLPGALSTRKAQPPGIPWSSQTMGARSSPIDFSPLLIPERGASAYDTVHGSHPPPSSGFEFACTLNRDEWRNLYFDFDRFSQ